MAFNEKALRVEFGTGSYGSSPDGAKFFRQASYITTDAPATVEAADYFNAAAKRLPKGTVITAVMSMSGTPVMKNFVVTANSGTAVTIAVQEASAGAGVAPLTVLEAQGVSSKASDAAVVRWVAPFKFKINKLRTVLNAVLATADATVTLAIGATPVTGGVATITSVGAAGDIDEATPTAANTGAAGALITATVGGGSTATGTLNMQLELEEIP